MPFGLKNAGQTFQRMMDEILSDLDYLFVYMDDRHSDVPFSIPFSVPLLFLIIPFFRIQIYRYRWGERVGTHGHRIYIHPLQFGQARIEFLGHTVTKDGVEPLPEKVAAIAQFPAPSTQDDLRRFLGMINFYNRFIPNAAKIMKPLYEATAKTKKQLEWNNEMTKAFSDAKTAFARTTMLRHPRPGAEIAMSADASGEAVGVVLQQRPRHGGAWEPLAYFSKKLCPPETRYSAFDRELLAVYLGIRHFRHYLEGREFLIFTYHRPLTFAMAKSSEP